MCVWCVCSMLMSDRAPSRTPYHLQYSYLTFCLYLCPLVQLPYIEACFQEALRLFPPVRLTTRNTIIGLSALTLSMRTAALHRGLLPRVPPLVPSRAPHHSRDFFRALHLECQQWAAWSGHASSDHPTRCAVRVCCFVHFDQGTSWNGHASSGHPTRCAVRMCVMFCASLI